MKEQLIGNLTRLFFATIGVLKATLCGCGSVTATRSGKEPHGETLNRGIDGRTDKEDPRRKLNNRGLFATLGVLKAAVFLTLPDLNKHALKKLSC